MVNIELLPPKLAAAAFELAVRIATLDNKVGGFNKEACWWLWLFMLSSTGLDKWDEDEDVDADEEEDNDKKSLFC